MNKILTRSDFVTRRGFCKFAGVLALILSHIAMAQTHDDEDASSDGRKKNRRPDYQKLTAVVEPLTIRHRGLDATAVKYVQILESEWHLLDAHFNVKTEMQLQALLRQRDIVQKIPVPSLQSHSIFLSHRGLHLSKDASQNLTEYRDLQFKVTNPRGALFARREGWDLRLEFIISPLLKPADKYELFYSLLASFLEHEGNGTLQTRRVLVMVPARDYFTRALLDGLLKSLGFSNQNDYSEKLEASELLHSRTFIEYTHSHTAMVTKFFRAPFETTLTRMAEFVDSAEISTNQQYHEIRRLNSPTLNLIFKYPIQTSGDSHERKAAKKCWNLMG